MPTQRGARQPLIALLVLVGVLAVGYGVRAWDDSGTGTGPSVSASGVGSASAVGTPSSPTRSVAALPPGVAATLELIRRGGPFPYPDNDGSVFHNFEGLLPSRPDGYYHEYTVPTPGSPDRGARRIITGRPGEYWYTDDHYESFRRLDVGP